MKFLILDIYNYPRDLAQMDMYSALKEKFEVIFANSKNILDLIYEGNYDYLYLGIFHQTYNLPWNLLFDINKKPIIIDQADNESFIYKSSMLNYKGDCILLSRYLPNEKLENFWKGKKLYLLPWYINPDRFKPKEKKIDVSFVCMLNINRIGADRKKLSEKILEYCKKNGFSYKIGEYWGDDYKNIIAKSKAMVIDGSRYCLTQKYIEASLSNCLIIGEKPISPDNELKVVNLENINYKNLDIFCEKNVGYNRDYILKIFANKEKFIYNFNKILSGF